MFKKIPIQFLLILFASQTLAMNPPAQEDYLNKAIAALEKMNSGAQIQQSAPAINKTLIAIRDAQKADNNPQKLYALQLSLQSLVNARMEIKKALAEHFLRFVPHLDRIKENILQAITSLQKNTLPFMSKQTVNQAYIDAIENASAHVIFVNILPKGAQNFAKLNITVPDHDNARSVIGNVEVGDTLVITQLTDEGTKELGKVRITEKGLELLFNAPNKTVPLTGAKYKRFKLEITPKGTLNIY